jgi:hypothetical protein
MTPSASRLHCDSLWLGSAQFCALLLCQPAGQEFGPGGRLVAALDEFEQACGHLGQDIGLKLLGSRIALLRGLPETTNGSLGPVAGGTLGFFIRLRTSRPIWMPVGLPSPRCDASSNIASNCGTLFGPRHLPLPHLFQSFRI